MEILSLETILKKIDEYEEESSMENVIALDDYFFFDTRDWGQESFCWRELSCYREKTDWSTAVQKTDWEIYLITG